MEGCKIPTLDEKLDATLGNNSIRSVLANDERIRVFCEQHQSTPFQFLQAAWSLFLQYYTGDDTVSFGVLGEEHGARSDNNVGYETSYNLIDLCTNNTVSTDSFAAIVHRLNSRDLASQSHVPTISHAVADTKACFAFDTALVEQQYDLPVTSPLTSLNDHSTTPLAIVIVFLNLSDGLLLDLHYSASRLSHVAVNNVAETLQQILDSVLTQPKASISQLNLLHPQQRQQLCSWNTQVEELHKSCVHELIEERALYHPSSPAIDSHDGTLTYCELDYVSSQIAKELSALGVTTEHLVPVCFEKSLWAVVAMLAILKAGGAFVPLDPLHPVERMRSIIKRTKASIVVTSSSNSALFENGDVQICVVGQGLFDSVVKSNSDPPKKIQVQPENAAFVLFTSGSTGQPKGIIQEHGSVCTNSVVHGKALNMDSQTRALQFAAFTFDVSMMDIFTTLILGGCVCMPSEDDRKNDIVGFINEKEVNWALLTPSFANIIEPANVPTLCTLALGGEAVTEENIRRWAGSVRLLNVYGPAEAGTVIVSEPISIDARAGTVGRRINSALCWLVDPSDHDKLVPIGATGELCVEGPTLARGYLADPLLTDTHFLENPLWLKAESGRRRRIYKVGDLLRQNTNGTFDFVGRVDSQVKIRGQRVELGEVEHQLLHHPAVAVCVVASPKSGQYNKRLVGVVQLQGCFQESTLLSVNGHEQAEIEVLSLDKEVFDTTHLIQHMANRVPPYMIPDDWILVRKIPLSTSAKTDRKKVTLWLMDVAREIVSQNHVNGDQTTTSGILATTEVIATELSIKTAAIVAPNDKHLRSMMEHHDFVLADTGLDSIQAISLAMHIRHKYGIKLSIERLTHKGASLRDVATGIEKAKHGTDATERIDVRGEWQAVAQELQKCVLAVHPIKFTVLVTGATGFLGTQILSDLLTRPDVSKVIVHVRADDVSSGLTRIATAASQAGWWSDSLLSRLEVWPGDLEQPQLGLTEANWDQLIGNTSVKQRVDIIIHNGASVRWNADFETLRAANVGSTMELLKAILGPCCSSKLLYVSGGQAITPCDEDEETILDNIAFSNGYCQTKIVSELLVKRLMRKPQYASRLAIVKPSYIIGSAHNGAANTADFLWRLVGSCIDIQAYNATDENAWLYISDVDNIASITVESCFDCMGATTKVLDRIRVKDFWAILNNEFGYSLQPLDQATWMDKVQKRIILEKENHRLWPLLDTLEECKGNIGADDATSVSVPANTKRVATAIKKNIEYLVMAGFFPSTPRQYCEQASTSPRGRSLTAMTTDSNLNIGYVTAS